MNVDNAISLRDATTADLSALVAIRSSDAHHRGRLRDALSSDFRYLVIQRGETLVGFVCVVYRRPDSWANVHDSQHLPQIVDLHIDESQRGRGYGSAAMHLIEQLVSQAGHRQLYIAVEPLRNPRAHALYQRLGYQPLQSEPYHHAWSAIDGDGNMEHGEAWLVDMVKTIA